MNGLEFARLLGRIDPQLIEEAADAGPMRRKRRKRLPLRLLIAAILVILASFTTALAANEEFRDTVKEFVTSVFQSEAKPSPEPPAEAPSAPASEAALTVQAFYPVSSRPCFGNLLYDDLTAAYYTATDAGFVPQETTHIDTTVELFDRQWKVIFDYAIVDGELVMYAADSQDRIEEEIEQGIYPAIVSPVEGTTDTVLLQMTLYDFRTIFYGYLVRYNFVTGAVEELLAGSALMDIPHAAGFVDTNESGTGAIANVYPIDGCRVYYYCDLTTGECWPVSELTGRSQDVEAECREVSESEVECRWISDDTLLLTARDDGLADVIRYNVKTGEMSTVLENFDVSRSNYELSFRHWLLNGTDGSYILDCLTGTEYSLNGSFTWFASGDANNPYVVLSNRDGALYLLDLDTLSLANLQQVFPALPTALDGVTFLDQTWCYAVSNSSAYLMKLPSIPTTPLTEAPANTAS